ncbi:MAG: DoxX family protein [Ignavibacterium sp.]
MQIIQLIAILVSGISFIIYGILLLNSLEMQNEFKRFGLEKFIKLTGVLELLGRIGMLVGLKYDIILLISSGGLTLLMLLGFGVRIKLRDGFWLSFPSFFFMALNLFVFFNAVKL